MYYEGLINIVRKGREGAEEIQNMMKTSVKILKRIGRFISGRSKDFKEQTTLTIIEKKVMNEIPQSNVLIYYTGRN
jgi:phosphoglucomutase